MSGFKHYFDKFLGKKEKKETEKLPLEEIALEAQEKEESEAAEPQDSLILEQTDINNRIIEEKSKRKFFSKLKKTEESKETFYQEDSDTVTVNKNVLLIWAIILIVICVGASFFVAHRLFFGGYFIDNSNKVSFNLEGTDNYALAKLQSVISAVENDFYPGVDKNVIAEGAIQGIVDALGDEYTVYYKPGTMEAYQEIINGEYKGMGVVVRSAATGLEVTKVYADSPASKAGVLEGDIITSVNDQSAIGMDSVKLKELLGSGGKELTLKLTDKEGKEKTVTLTVDTVKVKTVSSQPEGNGIYRVTISQFDSDTGNEFYTEITEIMGKGCRALILDLRNNGGGYESEAVKITDMLLPEGVIATSKDKNGKVIKEILSAESQLEMPLAVLVNGNTASASELLAGAVKDFGKGKIVGSKTFGKAIGQVQLSFDKDGSGLVITTACYYTPSGNCIQGKGITPDFHVELPEEFHKTPIKDIPSAKDNQLQKAIELITSELE
ncbi:MAG: PDZ domain-containing protein [Ruminococcaceae bacterium]|nr:PDZ domain-containing protein [Oscillospiraceae bacterium]